MAKDYQEPGKSETEDRAPRPKRSRSRYLAIDQLGMPVRPGRPWTNEEAREYGKLADIASKTIAEEALRSAQIKLKEVQLDLEHGAAPNLVKVERALETASQQAAFWANHPSPDGPRHSAALHSLQNIVAAVSILEKSFRRNERTDAVITRIDRNILIINSMISTIEAKLDPDIKDSLKRGAPSSHTQLESEAKELGARLRALSSNERARVVNQFLAEAGAAADDNSASGLSRLFSAEPSLPSRPPEKWFVPSKGRRPAHVKVEKVTEFIKRVYRDWYGRGLTRQHLAKIDPDLSTALRNWERLHPEDRLDDLPQNKSEFLVSTLRERLSDDQLRDLANALFTRVLRVPAAKGPK